MSFVKKCDRCGNLYEYYPIRKIKRNIVIETIAKYDLVINLCPECMDKFEKFMTAKFQEEEKKNAERLADRLSRTKKAKEINEIKENERSDI